MPNRPVARSTSRRSLASIVTEALCGSIPMTTSSIAPNSLAAVCLLVSEDGQRYFELSRPFLSHASLRHPAGTHPMNEPHQHAGGQPREERPTGHLTPACADRSGL